MAAAMTEKIKTILKSFIPANEPRYRVIALVAAVFCALFNLHTYFFNPPENLFLTAGVILAGFLIISAFFLLVSLNRYVFMALVPLIFFICSIGSYFVYTFDISITQNILGLAFDTNAEEAGALLGLDFFLWLAAHLLVAIVLVVVFVRTIKSRMPFKRLCAALVVLLVIAGTLIATVPRKRIPRELTRRDLVYSTMHSLYGYTRTMRQFSAPKKDISKGDFAYNNRDLVLVLIIGEGARADHFHINGYHRTTSPDMERLNVVSFREAMSSFSFTRKSVPCILTRAASKNYELSLQETGLISIFRRLGFYTAWISNQRHSHDNHDTPITVFAREADVVIFNNRLRADQYDYLRLDEELFRYMDQVLTLDYANKLIVLHTIGSHWNYNAHYSKDFMRFTPVARNNNPYKNSTEEIVNSYDNTILYTDHFIAGVIDRVKGLNSLVLYVSDHGEFLGENGRFSHPPGNVFIKELFHIPLFVWASPRYARENPLMIARLRHNSVKPVSHDHVFHSLLDGAGIVSPVIDRKLSVFR